MKNGQTRLAEAKPFSVLANESLLEVRTAVGQVVEACGVTVRDVQRAYRALKIDKKLAWRLAKVFRADDPYVAARHIPGRAAMRALFQHAEEQGVAGELIERGREAIARFERFADAHAPSRKAFDLMLSAHAATHVEETDVAHRKEATTALSYVWGVIAKAHLRTYVCRPNESGAVDVAAIGGFVDLQWIRPNIGWVVGRRTRTDDEGKPVPTTSRPLDASIGAGDVPLLREYCSADLPPVRRVASGREAAVDEIVSPTVGTMSATTCLLGEVNQGWFARYRNEHEDGAYMASGCRTPCEMLQLDLLLHRDLVTATPPTLSVFGDLEPGSGLLPFESRSRHRIMPWKELEHLGWGVTGGYTPYFMPYVEMLEDCLKRVGWEPSAFQLFRASIEYPAIPSTAAIYFELPEEA